MSGFFLSAAVISLSFCRDAKAPLVLTAVRVWHHARCARSRKCRSPTDRPAKQRDMERDLLPEQTNMAIASD